MALPTSSAVQRFGVHVPGGHLEAAPRAPAFRFPRVSYADLMPLVVLVTVPPDRAHDLARLLVGERLAGCVNIVPGLHSVYRWQGEVAEDNEALLIIKTEDDRYEALERRLVELHPYDVPEVLALPVARAWPAFLGWLADSVH